MDALFRYSCAIDVGFSPPTPGVDAVRPSIQYGITIGVSLSSRRWIWPAICFWAGRSSAATYCLTSESYWLFLNRAAFHGPFDVSGASR